MSTPDSFNAEAYWAGKPHKKWVVFVSKVRGHGKPVKTEKLYVGAQNYESACRTAKANSMLTGRITTVARLAHPADLGCVGRMAGEAS